MTDEKAKYIWDRLAEIQACGLELGNNIDCTVFHAINSALAALSITKEEAGVEIARP